MAELETTREGLLENIDSKIIDNTAEQITPAQLRELLYQLVYSANMKRSDSVPGPNLRPDLWKSCRWYSAATEGYDGAGPMLLALLEASPELFCLHTTIHVEFGPDGRDQQYALVYDENGPYQVYRDATFTDGLIPAKLTRLGTVEQVTAGIPEFNPYGPPGGTYRGPDVNGNNGAQVTYQDKIYVTKLVPLNRALFGGGLIPYPGTPGAAPFWKELSPTPVTHQQNTDAGTTMWQFTVGLNSQTQGTTEYRLLGFLADSQRANVALGARWTYQTGDGSDVVELVQCLNYAAPASNPANVWTKVGGGIDGLYLEEEVVLSLDAGGQTWTVNLAEALAPYRPLRRLFVVEGNDQAGSGNQGTAARPYATLTTAHSEAPAGSTIVVRRGGTGTDSLGRPAYTEGLLVSKAINWVGEGFPILNNYLELTGAAKQLRIEGLEFRLRAVVPKPGGGAHQVEFDNCRWTGNAFLQLYGDTATNPEQDVVTVRRSLFRNQQLQGGLGCVQFNQRNDVGPRAQTVILEDCELSSENTPLFTGTIHPDSRVILRGHTRLTVPDGYPLSSMTRLTGGVVPEADWLIDERAGVGTDSTEVVAQFQGSDPQQADLYIYADAVGTYQVHSVTGVVSVSYRRNGSAAVLPVSVVQGDTLSILATGAGTVRLRKQS